ncbi:MAG: hypothetical protein COB14_04385 [Alphaproteobacteria bacterium]|nr:MAG: hypothetical protein COB14_04385 [Alphaproteobacteria bacterium]
MKLLTLLTKASLLGLAFTSTAFAASAPSIELLNSIKTGDKKGTEIISIQTINARAAISNSIEGIIDIYSLATPSKPSLTQRITLGLAKGEQITSVAFHPTYNYVLAAIQASSPTANGRVEIRDANTGKILHIVDSGIGPDAVVIDPTGQFALIPNEGEEFILNREKKTYSSAVGSLTLIKLDEDSSKITATQIPLSEITDTAGFVKAKHHRFLERGIDWNNDGEITEDPIDLNGNGKIDKEKVVVGTFHGVEIKAKEKNGELFMFPILNNKPDVLEPEYVAFSNDGSKAWVVLQENNGVITVDTKTASISSAFGLGITSHESDLDDDDVIDFNAQLIALREPDGITLSKDGKYLVTADEGDTEPKASKTKDGPAGGGRTVSVFDAATGELLGDTGNQIDIMVNEAGFYPESRSDNKGSEPEMVTSFTLNGENYIAAGLERANGVALISLADPKHPLVVSVAPIDKTAKAGKVGPEGIAHFYDHKNKQHYIYTANEKNSSISTFRVNVK